MPSLRVSLTLALLLATACNSSPPISSVSPLVGKYTCQIDEGWHEGQEWKWTYELRLCAEGECHLFSYLHSANNSANDGGRTLMGRWEHSATEEGPETVIVFPSAYDASERLDLLVIGSGDELTLVSDDRKWKFSRVRPDWFFTDR